MSITLSAAAADRVQTFLQKRGHGLGVRLGVKTTGCSGLAYVLEFVDTLNPDDAVFEDRDVKVIIDRKSLVYLTGTEGLMGQAQNEAMQAGIPHTSIQTEHRGSVARRMQCVHCKGITEDVMTDPFVCSHCGLNLFVRDHYSRRLAAYQGVCIDAEDPGNVPEARELYT